MGGSMDPNYFFQRKELQKLFQSYGIDPSDATLIRANTNLIYDCKNCIIRLTPSHVRTKLEIESELSWLTYLAEAGAAVVRLISGDSPITVRVDAQSFWGVIFIKISGKKVDRGDWTKAHFEKLGVLSGQLHRLGKDYTRKVNLAQKHWDEIPEYLNYPRLSQAFPDGIELHMAVVRHIKTLPKDSSNYGLVHYDIHHGNYLLKPDGKLVLFDFELCCQTWYVHDVATVLYYAENHPKSRETENFQTLFLQHFLKGYQREFQTPSETEMNFIPAFLLYRDLMVYAYLLDIWAGKTLTGQQESYLTRIEMSIQKRRQIFGRL